MVDTSKLQSVRYTALSYCWGPPEVALHQSRSTSENIQANYDRIEFTALSPVIRDAVVTTASLGLRYLWVDALCIEQGSHEDWARESGQMNLVYSNAYFTIAAAKSKSCQNGFLERLSPVVILLKQPIYDGLSSTFSLHEMPHAPEGWGPPVGTLWQSRGWTQQEVLLSRRVLYFADSYICLSCPERWWVENQGIINKTPEPPGASRLDDRSTDPGLLLHLQRFSTHKNSLYALWNSLVEEYSGRTLGDPKDLLPAMSGMAKHFAGILGEEYIAGIWKAEIVRGLLWISLPQFRSIEELLRQLTGSPYVCPTWSWAQHAGIYFIPGDLEPEYEHMFASAVPENLELNPWGRIIKADLEVEARCVSYSSTVADSTGAPFYRRRQGDRNHKIEIMDISVECEHSQTASDGFLEQTTLILLASAPRISRLYGLVVYPLPDGRYIRVGMFSSESYEKDPVPLAGEAPMDAEHKPTPPQKTNLGLFRDVPFQKFHIV